MMLAPESLLCSPIIENTLQEQEMTVIVQMLAKQQSSKMETKLFSELYENIFIYTK